MKKASKSSGIVFFILFISVIATSLTTDHYSHKIVEIFSTPMVVRNGSTLGPGGMFTFSLDQNGTFIIDGKSGGAIEKSDSYRDSAIIRSTKPLPKTYKISIVLGEINYGLEKLNGLHNDPQFPEGPLNENGCYLLTITDELPNLPHINLWWHEHRKVFIDVDNNVWGHGMPNPIFMGYFDKGNALMTYDLDQHTWTSDWVAGVHYYPKRFYKVEIQKTLFRYILRIYSEDNKLLEEGKVGFNQIYNADHQEYFVVGDPHANYYQGSLKIKKITLQY